MDPFFTEEQLNDMSRENMMEVMRIMQNQVRKKETEVQLLKDKQKELEFMNAMLSDRLALAQRRRFGSSSEKYADGYEQMDLFNEAEVNADTDTAEIKEEIVISSHKRKKRIGKKEEDLSNFEVTETIEYKLTGKRATADQGKHCYSFAGCRNHECKVCQWHAAGKTGTGIRKV